jgi:hypothetical protein
MQPVLPDLPAGGMNASMPGVEVVTDSKLPQESRRVRLSDGCARR